MALQIVINFIIAFMWMFLSESYTIVSFIGGFILGIILLFVLNRFTPGPFYMKKVMKLMKLNFIFFRELISSNLSIVKLVYSKKPTFEPGIFVLPTELETEWEVTLLANLITLTPGTLTISISHDNSKLYIHAMDIDTVDEEIHAIKETFEKAIMEVTR